MTPEIRKVVVFDEYTHIEGGKPAETPHRMFAVAVVIQNPWAGRGFVDDLTPEVYAMGPVLGELLTGRIIELAGGPGKIEAYVKAAMVGLNCEIEMGSALIHTLRFGNNYREALDAKSYLAFTNTRAPANTQINIPLMDKHDAGRRSHYLTIQFSISDAPGADEIVIALGGSAGGRPHHRIGDRYQDLAAMGRDVDNPADV
jgi:hypothetical protein